MMKPSCEATLHSHPPCSGCLLFLLNHWIKSWCSHPHVKGTTPPKTNMTMENPPFEDIFPIEQLRFSNVMLVFRGTPWKIQDVTCLFTSPPWFQVRADGHSLPFTDASFDTVVGRVWFKLVYSVQSGVIFDGKLTILGLWRVAKY